MLYGPRPLDNDTSVESLKHKILEAKRQPWAQVKLYHKASGHAKWHGIVIFLVVSRRFGGETTSFQDVELPDDLILNRLREPSLSLTAQINGRALDIEVSALLCFFVTPLRSRRTTSTSIRRAETPRNGLGSSDLVAS